MLAQVANFSYIIRRSVFGQVILEVETVLLDKMSGFDFEEFFGHLLTKLGRGQVEKILLTHDEGRDILFRTPAGLIVVECKHHPNGTIGRPILQKLHSAVITSGATGGILVTTGHFTKEALGHATKISPRIEMIDRALLTEMAARAGIRMITKGEALTVWTLSIPDEKATQAGLGKYLDGILKATREHQDQYSGAYTVESDIGRFTW